MKYLKTFENFKSGMFKTRIDDNEIILELEVIYDENTEVKLLYNDIYYDDLSVTTPDSENLEKNEFFVNPEIDENIVISLVEQGFITKSDKTTLAGDKETGSYLLNI